MVATTGEAMALSAETQRLLKRAADAVQEAPLMGPTKLGRFVDPMQRIHDLLAKEVPELEAVVAELHR